MCIRDRVKYPEGDVLLKDETAFDDYKPMTMILRYLLNAQGVPPMLSLIHI